MKKKEIPKGKFPNYPQIGKLVRFCEMSNSSSWLEANEHVRKADISPSR